MTNFELYCDKWEVHNTAINAETYTLDSLPTVRIKVSPTEYKLGFTLHKWKMQPSGQALAIVTFGSEISNDDLFWTSPDIKTKDFKTNIQKCIDEIKEQSIEQLICDIEEGKCSLENLHIFKYHASQWREVTKPKSKWTYIEKAEKSEICNVQRLLNS